MDEDDNGKFRPESVKGIFEAKDTFAFLNMSGCNCRVCARKTNSTIILIISLINLAE